MPEILTESFCERCGTRYTFEAAAPKGRRLGKIKVLSKGLVNFVTDDDTKWGEAFADARSDELRELTGHQLEAFHKTFQFCMSCRQYTCGNCWNEGEGKCLSCAPHLGQEILEAPFPNLDPLAGLALAEIGPTQGGNGHGDQHDFDATAWPIADLPPESPEPEPEAQASEVAAESVAEAAPLVDAESVAEAAPVEVVTVGEATPLVEAATVVEAASEPIDDDVAQAVADATLARRMADDAAAAAALAASAAAAAADRVSGPTATGDSTPTEPSAGTERAAAASAQTSDLLGRFRPGRKATEPGDDADLAAAVGLAAAAASAETTEIDGAPERLPVASLSAAALAADAAVAELRQTASDEPDIVEDAVSPSPAVQAVAPVEEPAAEIAVASVEPVEAPAAAASATPDPSAPSAAAVVDAPPPPAPAEPPAPARDDRVDAPVWRIVAPDNADAIAPDEPLIVPAPVLAPQAPLPTRSTAAAGSNGSPAAGVPGAGAPAPSWPTAANLTPPQWPMPAATPVATDLWAASSQDVLNRPGSGVQACVSCGLPLSASARFCRRCGSSQH